jgi:tetratricopeptide (TPR) repeat protein
MPAAHRVKTGDVARPTEVPRVAIIAALRDPKKALEAYAKAVELNPDNAQNAALTQMLLEKNPAAGPGAQQAVGSAVQSIAQGAAEGDARSQQALDLLKANKIAEATPLLKAVAEDKKARAGQETALAEKERKDAAIAYRNLGAIAGLADPKQALEAYEKALALDPDDLKSLFWTGWIQIDYGDLNKAQARLERVLPLAKTDAQALYKNWALLGLGDIETKRGDLAGALKSYNDGLAIIDRLAKSDPGNAGLQRDLSMAYNAVGDVQMAQGNLAGALKSYQDDFHRRAAGEIRPRQCEVAARSLVVLRKDRRRANDPGRPCRRAKIL